MVIMSRPPIYTTPEAQAEARRRNVAKYNASAKRKAAMARYTATGAAAEATRRYRRTDRYDAKRAELTPDQFAAWTAIRYATQSGKVTRPKACQSCGAEKRIEAHHYLGYAPEHRLDVQWLCGTCHIAAHGAPRKAAHS